MKRILLFSTLAFSFATRSQNLIVQSGASFIAAGTPTIVLNNMGLDAALNSADLQNANLTVSGNAACTLKNSSAFINLQKFTVDKPGATVTTANNMQVYNSVQMLNGLLDLKDKQLFLASASVISGETETARITASAGGFIEKVLNLGFSTNYNPGGMGVYVTIPVNTGLVTVRRGHKVQTGSGLSGGINRYFEFVPATNTALNATLKLTYFDAELANVSENLLQPMESSNGGGAWVARTTVTKDAAANFITTGPLNGLYRYTLGAAGAPLPVLGLEFFAKRLDANKVQLDWKTIQEMSNKGFDVERKRESDAAFVQKGFVASKAAGGSSSSPLNYVAVDTNSYNGKTYYRIKQTDLNGSFIYSLVRTVDGSNAKAVSLSVWPVPAVSTVNVQVQGVATDELQVWNTAGQVVKQVPVTGTQTVVINGLAAGSYFVRLKSNKDLVQKIVMQ